MADLINKVPLPLGRVVHLLRILRHQSEEMRVEAAVLGSSVHHTVASASRQAPRRNTMKTAHQHAIFDTQLQSTRMYMYQSTHCRQALPYQLHKSCAACPCTQVSQQVGINCITCWIRASGARSSPNAAPLSAANQSWTKSARESVSNLHLHKMPHASDHQTSKTRPRISGIGLQPKPDIESWCRLPGIPLFNGWSVCS
jgi:hypothetical protein